MRIFAVSPRPRASATLAARVRARAPLARGAADRYPRDMAIEPPCCGACAHLAGADPSAPHGPPLRFELAPDAAPKDAWIVLLDRAVAITRRFTVIGRSSACDLVIPDIKLSRRTCAIEFDAEGRCFVVDLDSLCGVVVGGRQIQRAGLHAGDRVRIGDSDFTVERREPGSP